MSEMPALGLISMLFMRDTGELLATRRKLVARTTDCGYRLERVYVQSAGPLDTVFDLLGSLLQSDGVPLVIPTLHHLSVLGNPLDIRDHLVRSDHQVLIASESAERTYWERGGSSSSCLHSASVPPFHRERRADDRTDW